MHHIITPESIVYQRPVQYYETDRMQIVHHSNYIRWMEEIRVAFMAQKGVPYDQMEHNGILMPVLGVTCSYHIPFQFGETFQATCKITEYNGVRLALSYEIYKPGGISLLRDRNFSALLHQQRPQTTAAAPSESRVAPAVLISAGILIGL